MLFKNLLTQRYHHILALDLKVWVGVDLFPFPLFLSFLRSRRRSRCCCGFVCSRLVCRGCCPCLGCCWGWWRVIYRCYQGCCRCLCPRCYLPFWLSRIFWARASNPYLITNDSPSSFPHKFRNPMGQIPIFSFSHCLDNIPKFAREIRELFIIWWNLQVFTSVGGQVPKISVLVKHFITIQSQTLTHHLWHCYVPLGVRRI